MNAICQTFEFEIGGLQVDEVVASIFHSVLFHRTLGKFHYQDCSNYYAGNVGYQDVDCDFIDLTYVRCSSDVLDQKLKRHISQFSRALRGNETSSTGQISLEFYQKKKKNKMLNLDEEIPWEVWNITLELVKVSNEQEKLFRRERVSELLTEKILYIADVMNRCNYMPITPSRDNINLIFDTSYTDIQPYLFRLYHTVSGPSTLSVGQTIKKMIKEILLM